MIALPGILFATAAVLATASVPSAQTQALLDIYTYMGGKAWTQSANWGQAGTECTWFGVMCDPTDSGVVKLRLAYTNLIGTVSASIENLSNLTYVRLWSC